MTTRAYHPQGVRRASKAAKAATTPQTYDSLNRLTQDVLTDSRTPANSSTTAYTYGDTGNRATKTVTQNGTTTTTVYTYDADDRLTTETTAAGATSYAWDANGNLVQKTEPTQTTLYTWDSNNRLQSVARGTSAATATTVATYQYDANGNRVGKTLADGTKISYLVDGNYVYAQVAQETDTSPTGAKTETDYLYGLERIEQTRAGQGTYYHDDGLGSTRVLTDVNGNVTDSYEYDDYGALQAQTGTTKNDFMYAGEAYDQEANLSYNRARYLDVNVGRFTGLDPFGGEQTNPITLNKYVYANSDPVNGRDPSGLADTNLMSVSAAMAVTSVLLTSYEVTSDIMQGNYRMMAFDLAMASLGVAARAVRLAWAAREAQVVTNAWGAIGSTGKIGEDFLKLMGGEPQVGMKTSLGWRYIDQLVSGVAHECKVGAVFLTHAVRKQIAEDFELLQTGQINGAVWNFFRSPVTGLRGPSQALVNALNAAGIKIVYW